VLLLFHAVVAEEDEDVRLEYFLRAPASIGVDAPTLTPSSKVRSTQHSTAT
jgi:hypothetical protein